MPEVAKLLPDVIAAVEAASSAILAIYSTALGGVIGGPLLPISARIPPGDGHVVLSSRSHDNNADIDAFLTKFKVAERRAVGSSLKFCRIAEGAGDLYPRFGPTSEWDIAA